MTIGRIWWRLLEKILPRRTYLSLDLRRTDRLYGRLIRRARKEQKGNDAVESLAAEASMEIGLIHMELDPIETSYWRRKAARFHATVPELREVRNPDYPEVRVSEDETWEFDHNSGRWHLSAVGIAVVRSQIREEQKWRREHLTGWVTAFAAVVGALTGLIGALIGLAAVWPRP